MIDGYKCTTDVAVLLKNKLSAAFPNVEFHKFRKTTDYKGEYIVVNFLPFVYGGKPANDYNRLNVNVHVPELKSGNIPTIRLTEIKRAIEDVIPCDAPEEGNKMLHIDGAYYSIVNVSQPMDDDDSTWFINIAVKVIFNN